MFRKIVRKSVPEIIIEDIRNFPLPMLDNKKTAIIESIVDEIVNKIEYESDISEDAAARP